MSSPSLLTLFVVVQLAFDVALLVLFVVTLARRRPPAPEPTRPDWYGEFTALAQDLLAATEPLLDELERHPAPRADGERSARHREAMALLRAGVDPDEVARRGRLLPGEIRLIRNVVAAEGQSGAADR